MSVSPSFRRGSGIALPLCCIWRITHRESCLPGDSGCCVIIFLDSSSLLHLKYLTNVGTACLCRLCGSWSRDESQVKGEIALLSLAVQIHVLLGVGLEDY